MLFLGGIGSKIRVWKFMQIVFRPKRSFVKSVPGDELLDVVEAPVEDGDVALVAIARSGAENSETDVTILHKNDSNKIGAHKMASLTQNTPKFYTNWIITLVFKKNAIFFLKLVTITLTPEVTFLCLRLTIYILQKSSVSRFVCYIAKCFC
jgi:hypothetical protein